MSFRMSDFLMIPQDDADESMDESEHAKLMSRDMLPANGDAIVELWLRKFEENTLSFRDIRDYLRVIVPRIYSPEPNTDCLAWSFDEERSNLLLKTPLEKFIFKGEDPQDALQKLACLNKPSSVCGRVFKMGEPAYCCRECGMDNTCVLCVDCFKNSLHRLHKYKIGTSMGGGCCDCGDVEAWRSDPFCEIHAVGTLDEEPPPGLPEDLVARTKELFSAILGYCFQLLTLENSPCLPIDLRLKEDEQSPLEHLEPANSFCTVLYNDEIHTFEQVITTLNRIIKCNQKQAVEYVTNIDREGRAVVKCASLQHCNDLKHEIEKHTTRHGNKPLKVHVVHAHVIAHQIYAMKLLHWIENFVTCSEGFRKILSMTALSPRPSETTIAEGVLLRDCQLWKAARTAWHRLLIAGMLKDYDSKKALALVFIKNYGSVIKDFITDDHDHAFSVSSLSVQIYTVPTLAHHLIANEGALFILLNTFLSECVKKCNSEGKLEFERNSSNTTFKRAQYILYDLKYLLSVKPETWTDDLRRGFLQGLTLILKLLTMMQGMDSVVRQVGQHMEFEPEWESAFNLHIKLATVISVVLDWCGTDKVVLIKAYRATLKQLSANPPTNFNCVEPQELADHSASSIQYNVASKPVSIHLPLSRFLAGLHLQLHKFGLTFDSQEFQTVRPSPEQIIEPVLRTQVMIAQVHAGMWRRNGYAILNQLYFYHNVKCRSEMLDRDIVLLQVGASLIESNEFLIHLLNKFDLMGWARVNFESYKVSEEDKTRQVISLVEEFLGLLITIIGERHVPGVGECTPEERTKKEIIQQLCISPLSHSELNKTLPEDQLHETGLENVIDEIADFKKPVNGKGCGVYSLRPHLFSEYNVFFYHYTREELSKSEEVQRKRQKTEGELECCPPPDLPQLTSSLSMLGLLLQCDVMLHIMGIVLSRSVDLHARTFSEMQLHKVLHLMGMALQEEESGRYPFLVFSERAARRGLVSLLIQLQNSARVEAHRDLLTWTVNKFREVGAKKNIVIENQCEVVGTVKSNTDSSSTPQESEKVRRAKLAAERRAKIMAQMQAMQNNFMKENAELFDKTETDVKSDDQTNTPTVAIANHSPAKSMKPLTVCPNKNVSSSSGTQSYRSPPDEVVGEMTYTCILCQEDTQVSINGRLLVLAGFIQQSTVLLNNKTGEVTSSAAGPICLSSSLAPAPHISTCGHIMHSDCWQKYFENVVNKETRRPYRMRHPAPFNIEKQEFLCPLCECLSNTVLPLIPSLKSLQTPNTPQNENISFEDWINGLLMLNDEYIKEVDMVNYDQSAGAIDLVLPSQGNQSSSSLSLLSSSSSSSSTIKVNPLTEKLLHAFDGIDVLNKIKSSFYNFYPSKAPHFEDTPKTLIMQFASAVYSRGLGTNASTDETRILPVMWASVAYTLHSIDAVSQVSEKPLFGELSSRHNDCLQALIRIAGILAPVSNEQGVIRNFVMKLLRPFIGPSGASDDCILDWDPVGYLVALTMCHPSLFLNDSGVSPIPPDNTINEHISKLTLLLVIVKAMITTNFDNCKCDVRMEEKFDEANITETETIEESKMLKTLKKIRDDLDVSSLNGDGVWEAIKKGCHGFLRNTCMFYHYLLDVPPSPELSERGGDTFENMCTYLGLPFTFDEIFSSSLEANLASEWCRHHKVVSYLKSPQPSNPRPGFKLVSLPYDYSELINTVSLFTCPNSDREDSRNPTMCLICGRMLCSQSYCCQVELNKITVGACTYHTQQCGGGVGIFLRVRECEILLLSMMSKGCVAPPPYVDQYGETDQGLRRGNPLHLCEDKYNKLQMLWLNHGIHEEIARSIESSTTLINPTWQLL